MANLTIALVAPHPAHYERLPAEMRGLPQWALAGADKAPLSVNASGKLFNASATQPDQWLTYERALELAERFKDHSTSHADPRTGVTTTLRGLSVGFLLHQNDPFSVIDLDVKDDTPAEQLDLYQRIEDVFESYTERSRSGRGKHIWVRGKIGRGFKRDGVEVYSQERFIICTGDVASKAPVLERQELLTSMVSRMRSIVDAEKYVLEELPEDVDDWYVLQAIHESTNRDRFWSLWKGDWAGLEYPSQSEADMALLSWIAFHTMSNAQVRRIFRQSELGKREKATKDNRYLNRTIQKIRAGNAEDLAFGKAFSDVLLGKYDQRASSSSGIRVLPTTEQAQHAPTITLEFAMASDTATIKVEYLLDPYLPTKCVVGFFGRGSTAKSSFLASMAAEISGVASTLWVSVEEPADWVKVRHIKCGAIEGTLAVVKAVASERDQQGRVIASTFNVYEHLDAAIEQAKGEFAAAGRSSLRLVVLDTAVGLTAWAKGESPNDDAAVKKLLGFLQALAERHDLTIAFIGHSNKGKHDHFADTVMGATAWTNSPRLSFVHAADLREDYAYVMRVAKTNFDPFGVPYRTVPVHTLYERANGPDTVLVRVERSQIVWGNTASMEMFEEATKKPREGDEDDTWGGGRRLTVAEIVRNKVVEMVHSGKEQFITRDQVECQLPDVKINRAQWSKVDSDLRGLPAIHKVEVGLHPAGGNKTIYRVQLASPSS